MTQSRIGQHNNVGSLYIELIGAKSKALVYSTIACPALTVKECGRVRTGIGRIPLTKWAKEKEKRLQTHPKFPLTLPFHLRIAMPICNI